MTAQPTARLLTGKPVAEAMNTQTRNQVAAFVAQNRSVPILAVVSVGANAEATRYAETLRRAAAAVNIGFTRHDLPADTSADGLIAHLHRTNDDAQIAGIIVTMPLPGHIPAVVVEETLSARKDVDGITLTSAGRLTLGLPGFAPATPLGGLVILKHYDIALAGQRVVVVGRSAVVGRPFAQLLLRENATVTIAHSHTRDLAAITREADILAVAVGRPGFITPEMVRSGATVVDFGTNYTDAGLRGDVHPDAITIAGAMTPVPDGTGPVTNAVLMRQVIEAAESRVSTG